MTEKKEGDEKKSQHPAESKPTTSTLDDMSSTAVLQPLPNADSIINGFFHWSHQKAKLNRTSKDKKVQID